THPLLPPSETLQVAQKGPAARRRPKAAREAYSLYVERAVKGANEADGPFSATCALVVDAFEPPRGVIVGEPAERPIAQLHVPLVAVPRALRPPLSRGAPRAHARHDPPSEPARSQMDRAPIGERHPGGQRRPHPAQGE